MTVQGGKGSWGMAEGLAIVRGTGTRLEPVELRGAAEGLSVEVLVGAGTGSVHLELALSQLEPGGVISGHIHPFEESFALLSGQALLAVGGDRHRLGPDDFGFVPVAVPHAWSNPYDEPVRWLRMRSPQPRLIGQTTGTYASDDVPIPTHGRAPDELDVTSRWVGHFSDADMSPPGPLSMPGYHGHNIRDISVRMMVDAVLGAQHHTLFMVEFAVPTRAGLAAKEHFHPFEEAYFILRGTTTGTLGGERYDLRAGDCIWAGTGTSHGYVNTGDEPLRWIEVQAPAPPPSNAFFFDDDWKALDAAGGAR